MDLKMKPKKVYEIRSEEAVNEYVEDYKTFLGKCKTSRETILYLANLLEKEGFENFEKIGKTPFDLPKKFYAVYREKMLVAFHLLPDLSRGLNLVSAHVDSPKLDFKPLPVIEKEGFAIAKTHYYGGIKKYQWFGIPLAIRGVIVKTDGTKLNVDLDGEGYTFVIADLPPHLDRRKGEVGEVFKGEDLNVILASVEEKDVKEDALKLKVLKVLNAKYGINEEDLVSAELEVVPAIQPQYVGLDSSMVGGYGQDDRVCAYAAVKALVDAKNPKRSMGIILVDKEEIGSEGNTSARHHFWLKILRNILRSLGDELEIDDVLMQCSMISGDVCAGVNPSYPDVHDLSNAPRLNHGITLMKYMGKGGKYSTNEANAEFVAKLRRLFNEKGIIWQIGELGKVDQGGGGTISKYFAELGMEVIDAGPPLVGMHSPFEIASKYDMYETYMAFSVFLESFE